MSLANHLWVCEFFIMAYVIFGYLLNALKTYYQFLSMNERNNFGYLKITKVVSFEPSDFMFYLGEGDVMYSTYRIYQHLELKHDDFEWLTGHCQSNLIKLHLHTVLIKQIQWIYVW